MLRVGRHVVSKTFWEQCVEVYKYEPDWMFLCSHQMTPQEVADESGHVNITKFLQKGRIPEDTEEFPRNISMMDISVLAVGGYC